MRPLFHHIRRSILACAALVMTQTAAFAETFDSTIADMRTLAFFKVDADALQPWLPDTHVSDPYAKGSFSGANILFMFIDRMLHQDANGDPKNGGAYRMVAMIVRGKDTKTGETTTFISRVYAPSDGAGPYKTQRQAEVSHALSLSGTGTQPLSGRHAWTVKHDGGEIAIGFDYIGAVPGRRSGESVLSTPLDASVSRIYRFDQLTDVVNSAPKGIDRTSNVSINITIPELSTLFDGAEQLIGLADRPFYTRETFKP